MKISTFAFEDVFEIAPDGVPVLKRLLVVADIPLLVGAPWRQGFRFAGWDIAEHMGQPLVATDDGEKSTFLGFAKCDASNPGWAKGWVVLNRDGNLLYGFYPTEFLANGARQEAG